jgi:hypothetical protein
VPLNLQIVAASSHVRFEILAAALEICGVYIPCVKALLIARYAEKDCTQNTPRAIKLDSI